MSTPLRTSGSPLLPIIRLSERERLASLCVQTRRPVNNSPQVAALTNRDGLRPMCDCQLPLLILSRINASRVALSGIRSRASARHISATPSCEESENSCNKPCTIPARPLAVFWLRSLSARSYASLCACSAMGCGRRACSISIGTASVSARRYAAVIAARETDCGRICSANSRKG